MSVWTDEKVAELQKLVSKGGLSASQIAVRLGDVSRNSVIGKVHRLRLAAAQPMAISFGGVMKPTRRAKKSPVKQQRHPVAKLRAVLTLPPAPLPTPSERDMSMLGVSLLELSPNGCRFAVNSAKVGEPHLFCNAPRFNGLSYCPEHAARCFEGLSKFRPTRPSRMRRAA